MTGTDVQQEKQHIELIHGVETFKQDRLKRTNTTEKIILPNAQGSQSGSCFLFWLRKQNNQLLK